MKKTGVLIVIILAALIDLNAQEKCRFFINNGTQEVDGTACGAFNILKVQVPIPANASSYNLISICVHMNEYKDFLGYRNYLKEEVKNIAGKTGTYCIFNSANPDSAGDFTRGLSDKNQVLYFNGRHLCEYPMYKKLKEVTLQVWAQGYMVTGQKKVLRDGAYYMEDVYNEGTTIVSGSIKITPESIPDTYTDKNNILKLAIIDPTSVYANTKVSKNELDINYEMVNILLAKPGQKFEERSGNNTTLNILIIKDEEFNRLESYKKLSAKHRDYTAYDFLKDEIENKLNAETYTGDMWTKPKSNYKPSVDWIQNYLKISACSSPIIEKKRIKNILNSGNKGETLWKKKRMGNYEYDNIYIEKAYEKIDKTSGAPFPFDVYTIYRKPYIILFGLAGFSNGKWNTFYNRESQIEAFSRTVSSFEFLK